MNRFFAVRFVAALVASAAQYNESWHLAWPKGAGGVPMPVHFSVAAPRGGAMAKMAGALRRLH